MSGFFAILSRMKFIIRWGLMRCTRTKTLCEHTLDTAILTHALIEIANTRFGKSLDPGRGVLLALYHDSAEILTGDLPTPIKYHDESIRGAYKAIEAQAGARLLAMLPQPLRDSYRPYLVEDGTMKEYIPYVRAADKLSAVIKCVEEAQAGNREFEVARQTLLAHKALQLEEAQVFLREHMPAYSLTLDEVEEGV
jgi:5'-deoxynucleotidase